MNEREVLKTRATQGGLEGSPHMSMKSSMPILPYLVESLTISGHASPLSVTTT